MLSLWGGSEKDAFLKVTAAFTKATGSRSKYTTARDFVPVIRTRLAAGNPPDVAIIPRPGVLTRPREAGRGQGPRHDGDLEVVPALRATARRWIKLGTVNGKIYGVAAKANSKSVMWYRPDQFKKFKLKSPKTWAQLLAVTKALKAKGRQNPWAQGAKDSWTLTDWFENIYARTAGPAKYLSLFSGKTKFTDPSVKKAIQQMPQVLNNKYLVGGVQGALGTAFVDGIGRVFGKKPTAQLYIEGGFVGGIALDQVNTSLKPGKTINSFFWPDDQSEVRAADGRRRRPRGGVQGQRRRADVPEVHLLACRGDDLGLDRRDHLAEQAGGRRAPTRTSSSGRKPQQVAAAKVFLFDGSDTLPGTLARRLGRSPAERAPEAGKHQQPPVRLPAEGGKGVLDRIRRQRPRERGRCRFIP